MRAQHIRYCLAVNAIAVLLLAAGVALLRHDSQAASFQDGDFSRYVMDRLSLLQQTVETENGEFDASGIRELTIIVDDADLRLSQSAGPRLRYSVKQTLPKDAPLSPLRTVWRRDGDKASLRFGIPADQDAAPPFANDPASRKKRRMERWGEMLDRGRMALDVRLPTGFKGKIVARSKAGDVALALDDVLFPVDVSSLSGDVRMSFVDGHFRYKLKSRHGDASAAPAIVPDERIRGISGPDDDTIVLEGQVGEGSYPVWLSSDSGDVTLLVAPSS